MSNTGENIKRVNREKITSIILFIALHHIHSLVFSNSITGILLISESFVLELVTSKLFVKYLYLTQNILESSHIL